MASKRANEFSLPSSSKTQRTSSLHPINVATIPYLTPLDRDDTELSPSLRENDFKPVPIPNFFEDQDGSGTTAEFDESAPHSAFHNTLQEFDINPKTQSHDLIKFLKSLAHKLEQKLPQLLLENIGLKAWLVVKVRYAKIDDPTKLVEAFHKTQSFLFLNHFEIQQQIAKMLEHILTESAHFMREASGQVYHSVIGATIQIAQHHPLVGEHHVELPKHLIKKNAIVNVKNTDNRCFGYAVLSALHPSQGDHPNRSSQYDKYFDLHNLQTLDYPVSENQIPELEDLLQVKINLFSFSHEGQRKYPLYTSKKNFPTEIDLLYWDGHYAWIKNFSRLMSNVTKHHDPKFFCKSCLGHFTTELKLSLHKVNCENGGYAGPIYTMPPPGKILKFLNIRNEMALPFKIFADCEALTLQANNPPVSSIYQNHVACSVGLKLISTVPNVQAEYWQCRGDNCVDAFLARLLELEKLCVEYLFDNKRMIFTHSDAEDFSAALECYICKKRFTSSGDKVRDHCHITGKYRGAAHNRCNLQLRKTYKIPVFFHNWRGYDSHLIVHKLPNYPNIRVNIIGQSMEKYLLLNWGDHIVFKDSLQFMNYSLEKLVSNLHKSGRDNFREIIKEYPGAQADLLLRKGVYPYDYMDKWEKFNETQLPPREAFFSRLRDEPCSEADYDHAQLVWREFHCRTLGDYHDLYLKIDVLQLADVWQSYSEICKANYNLDPAHYVSAPNLSWDAMLKCTDVNIELASDPAFFPFYDEGIRGGICTISKRYARANNPYMKHLFDPSKPTTYIIYLDANNLYGWAMSQPLPIGGYTWLTPAAFSNIDWLKQNVDQDYGYVIECDLDYPAHLHESHNDYPLAAERLFVHYSVLSGKQIEINRAYKMARNSKVAKLIPNLMPKRHYICDYLNLKFYLEHGLTLVNIHRVVRYKQSRWLAPYIKKNQDLRIHAANEFEKDFFKLMNNAVYGKTCENLKKRSDIRLVTNETDRKKLSEKVECMGFKIFGESLAAIQLAKAFTKIDKPTQVGHKTLESSKLLMLDFMYNFIKVKYGQKAQLLFTDTDSLMLEIETEDIYRDMRQHKDLFDFSGYPKEHACYDPTNNKVIGKFKDETNGEPIVEFLGLRAKMYSFTVLSDHGIIEKHRAKGITSATSRKYTHADYLHQLNEPTENYQKNRRIGSTLHNLYSMELDKRGLCAFDDKRFILANGNYLKPNGYLKINYLLILI